MMTFLARPSLFLSIYLSKCLSIDLSIYPYLWIFIHPSIYLSIYLSMMTVSRALSGGRVGRVERGGGAGGAQRLPHHQGTVG